MIYRLMYILALALITLPLLAGEPVPPVSSSPTNQTTPGKVTWIDLVTPDVGAAGTFYREVFGWGIVHSGDKTFANATLDGEPIATISRYDEGAPEGEAVWLISISVADVDRAADKVARNGGEVLEGPEDLPDRGRYVLVRDSQGAMLMLLQASGGDPADQAARDNAWLWAELWTDDAKKASAFYESVLGYRTVRFKDLAGDDILVMGRDSHPRATVVEIPWEDVEPNWLPYLQVADIDATAKVAEKHGGEVVIAPMKDATGYRVAVLADPTGGVFAIQQRAEP